MTATHHAESADGTRLGYRAFGDGPPLLLVHGSATSGADWLLALPHLRDRFTVVTMDRRGRGASGDSPDYSIEREAEDVIAVLEAVGADLLVAHSYGALCSITAAANGAALRRAVFYEPPIAVDGDRLEFGELERLIEERELDDALESFLEAAGAPQDQLAAIRSSPAWPVLLDAVPVLPRELRAGARWSPPPGPIDVEALFLVGAETENPVYLDGLDDVRAAFPGSKRESIAGQQHIAHVFAAAEFAALVTGFCGEPTA